MSPQVSDLQILFFFQILLIFIHLNLSVWQVATILGNMDK